MRRRFLICDGAMPDDRFPFADNVERTPSPTENELTVLRDLHARTEKVHAGKAMPHAGAN